MIVAGKAGRGRIGVGEESPQCRRHLLIGAPDHMEDTGLLAGKGAAEELAIVIVARMGALFIERRAVSNLPMAKRNQVAQSLFDARLVFKHYAIPVGVSRGAEEQDRGNAGLAKEFERFGDFLVGLVGEDDAVHLPGRELLEMVLDEVGLMARVTQNNLVTALKGSVFDRFGDFGEEAVGEVRQQKGDHPPRDAGALFGYQHAPAGLLFENSFFYQWFHCFAQGGARGAESLGHGALGGQENARRVKTSLNFRPDDFGQLLLGHEIPL